MAVADKPPIPKLPENIATNWVTIIAVVTVGGIAGLAVYKGLDTAIIASALTVIGSMITIYHQRRTASEARRP